MDKGFEGSWSALSADEAARATQVAPIFRMMYRGGAGRACVISFRPDGRTASDSPHALCMADGDEPAGRYESFCKAQGGDPALVLSGGLGYAIGQSAEDAYEALRAFMAGAPLPEAAQVTAPEGPLAGKIAVVTGAAQGFGLGIAEHLSALGAYVVLADINLPGARAQAALMRKRRGPFAAMAVEMDVTREDQVRSGIERTVCAYGGLDIFVSNAGVLRAGAVDNLSLEDFLYVTNVNYVGYFLCVKHAAAVMKRQNAVRPGYLTDIVQINSKSGLTGSSKNCSYAGSKFGGIGLTQSFALELAEFGIKVNAICPGNYLTGPLWSDPENGLFAQYLRTGKIKGAKTVEDLMCHYNSKVPMGRSCEAEDVARAVAYAIEQQYETGQALPVTGGQLMLK